MQRTAAKLRDLSRKYHKQARSGGYADIAKNMTIQDFSA